MPLLPILPQKSKDKHTPSLTFRRLTLFLILSVVTLSGLPDLLHHDIRVQPEFALKVSLAQQKPDKGNVLAISSASATTEKIKTTQIRQLTIGSEKLQPTPIQPVPRQSGSGPTPTQTINTQPTTTNKDTEWGIAHQIAPDTWSMKVSVDPKMASPQEILNALNDYRQRHGKSTLSWDDKLANFANSRVQYFTSINKLDSHAGFLDYVNHQDGFHKLGYANIGENSSIGYTLEAVHLIEWVYAGDKPHDDNQLSPNWQSVGIGVNASSTDLIFAGSKL